MTSRFLVVRVRPAGVRSRRLVQAAAVAEHGRWAGVLTDLWLPAEWPDGDSKPTRFWLSDLPDDTPITELVRLAKIRRRIEHDYRELKHGLGLFHFEGWHHHATLVTAAHPSSPNSDRPQSRHTGRTLYQILDTLQDLLNCWTGICTTCQQPLPNRTTPRSRQT